MNKKNLMPQMAQPVNRITTGQLPTELADMSEEALQLKGASSSVSVLPSFGHRIPPEQWALQVDPMATDNPLYYMELQMRIGSAEPPVTEDPTEDPSRV